MTDFRKLKCNLDVLMCFGHLVHPLIAEMRSVKCVVDDGEVHYVRDVGLLLQLLHIQHPVGQYLMRVVQSFINQHQTGAATLLFYIRSFARVVVSLTDQGLERRKVDRLIHAALEECIQYAKRLAIDFNKLSHIAKIPNQGFSDEDSRNTKPKTTKQSSTDTSSIQILPKELPNKLNQRDEKSKKSQQKKTSSTTVCKSQSILQHSPLCQYSSHKHKTESCTIEFDATQFEDTIHKHGIGHKELTTVGQRQRKPEFTSKDQSSKHMENSKAIKPDKSLPKYTNVEDKINSPVVELKMKSLQDDSKCIVLEDTDWFFDNTESSTPDDRVVLDASNAVREDRQNDDLGIEALKETWDAEFINDIKDLKEGIENDLRIVSERRERLNKKLANYIKMKTNVDNDDEFDHCFDGLNKEKTENTTKDESFGNYFDKDKPENSQRDDLHAADEDFDKTHTNKLETVAGLCKTDSNGSKGQMRTCQSSNDKMCKLENRTDTNLVGNNVTVKDEISSPLGQLNCQRRHLNNIGCKTNTKAISETLAVYSTDKTIQESKHKQILMDHFPISAGHNSPKESNELVSKNKLETKTSIHKIDNLLAGLGVADAKLGTGIKNISRSSRHVGQDESDVGKSDEASLTLEVKVDLKSKVPSEATTDSHGKRNHSVMEKGGELEDRNAGVEPNSRLGMSRDMVCTSWLVQLIRCLCPQTDLGIAEVVHQAIIKQLGTKNNDQRTNFEKLNASLIGCYNEICVIPRQPKLVDGVLISTKTDNMSIIQQWREKPCRMLMVNGDLQPNYHHKGYKKISNITRVGGVELLSDHVTQDDQWLIDVRTVLREHCVSIVLVRGSVCDQAELLCHQEGIVISGMVEYKTLEILAEASQTDMVTYLTLTSENNICCNVTVLPWRSDWMDKGVVDKCEVVLKIKDSPLQTVVFCDLTNQMLSLKEQDFWECLHLTMSALKSGYVLPGGGRTEAGCMEFCWRRAAEQRCKNDKNQPEAYLPIVFEELADVFKEYLDNFSTDEVAYNGSAEENAELKCDEFHSVSQMDASSRHNTQKQLQEFSAQMEQDKNNDSQKHLSQNTCDSSLVNSCRNRFYELDDIETQTNWLCAFEAALDLQSADCGNCSNYLDDYVTKLAAWRMALDTVSVILDIDSFVQTGLSDESTDKKCHSAL